MNIFVSNLTSAITSQQVRTLFSEFGVVQSAIIIKHDIAQKLGNYCWVVMQNRTDAGQAIKELNNMLFMHQNINVAQAIFALRGV